MKRLEGGLSRPLTLVSAPAGWGKTTLLTQWRAGRRSSGPVAWPQLGPETDDRRVFWRTVCAAAAAAEPGLAGLEVPPRGSLQDFLPGALETLDRIDQPLVVVLDDFQVVRSPGVASDIDWLLEKAPPKLRLLISTRSDPPLRLERLRLGGQMTELRAADLAFTQPESEQLLGELALSGEDLGRLWRRTEGWVGGLRLAQLSLERRDDRHAFVMSFTGDDRAVSDYLMSEVVERQPAATLDFLLRTCVADRLTGDLADALTGGHEGNRALRNLERVDGLASEVDGHGRWYRYHPLMVEVLRAESRRRLPAQQARLHRLAARWHADHGSALEAVRHAVEAPDYELAGEVIGERWLVLVTRGGGSALRELAERIPPEVVRADAELALAIAGLRLEAGDESGADELLAEARRLAPELPAARARRFGATSTATALYRARLRGDVEEALAAARLVLDEHWDADLTAEVRALTLANLGIAEFWAGDTDTAGQHLQQAAGVALECSNDFVLFLAETYAAAVDGRAGRLDDAWSRASTAIELAERRGWTGVAHLAIAYGVLGSVHFWRGELGEAQRMVERASAALTRSPEPLIGPAVALLRAGLLSLKGEPLAALDAVRGASAHGPLPPLLHVVAETLEADLWLRLGEPDRARAGLVELREEASDGAVGLARLQLAEGAPGGALETVEAFMLDDRDAVIPFARVEAMVLDAIARDALRDEDGALVALEQALDMAEPRGCPTVVVRYGAPLRSLLRRLVARGTRHRALAEQLQGMLDKSSRSAAATVTPLLEPLSERELTVLRFLPTMMSNAEIAAEMFVSVNTVKTHLKHVYRKLDVTDRRDCVKRGRQLRLLSPGVRER